MTRLLTFLTMSALLAVTKGQSQMDFAGTGQLDISQVNPFGSGIMFMLTTTQNPCQSRPHHEKHMYEHYIPGFDWQPRLCPPGTLYSAEACACHNIDLRQVFVCRPELVIDFNDNVIDDSSGNHISIGNNGNVLNFQNAGRFDGTGVLAAFQYSKQSFGTKLTITLRFYKSTGGTSNDQVLISNCIGGRFGSVEIALDLQTKEIVFRIESRVGSITEQAEVRQPFTEGVWTNVKLMYDGSTVTAEVDGSTKTAPLQGNINTRYNGIMIGSCHGRGFVGYIDDVHLYRCLLK